jgi:hypothetical protein
MISNYFAGNPCFYFLFPKTVGSILRGAEERDRFTDETVTVDSVHVLHLNTDKGELLTYRNSLNFDFYDLLLATC